MKENIVNSMTNIEKSMMNMHNEECLKIFMDLSEGIFHDFKNILATISGLSQLTLMQVESKEARENLLLINDATFECREAIERFYSLIKGHNVEDRDYIALGNIIFNALDMVKHRVNISSNSDNEINLNLNLNSLSKIYCNEYKMRQEILNIILNALDAMEETKGVLEINLYEESGNFILEISDTGIGIAEENLENIFKSRFTTKGDRGTGYGLRISKDIFQEYGGEIFVESKLGVGSKFTIKLPIWEEDIIEKS